MKTYYIIYKTTCLINGKIYIGQHQTTNPEDKYLGSGILLHKDIKLFGEDQFKKENLFFCEDYEEMNNLEKQIVDEEFVSRDDTYNCQVGGQAEDLDKSPHKTGLIGGQIFAEKLKNDPEFRKAHLQKWHSKENIQKRVESTRKTFENQGGWSFTNKRHTDESKKKIGKANSKHQKGKGNSNYGHCWIYNKDSGENKTILKSDIMQWLNKGWVKGRKII